MKARDFTTNAEIAELVRGFEEATLSAAAFTHRAHVAVALSYMDQMPLEKALARMRENIRRFASHHGAEQLYHETLTVFWMRLLGYLSSLYKVDLPLWQRVNLISARWATRLPVEAHYSHELIQSKAARESWIPPDRLPLPF